MSKRIVAIDDELDLLEIMEIWLSENSYEVFTADNGSKGLEQVRRVKPDLIILDVVMPGMDGLQVLSKLREIKETHSTPVLMLTGKTKSEINDEAKKCPPVDFLHKPFGAEELLEAVERGVK